MMRRLITNKFEQWKTDGASKPLMVIGARQTGKTYSINEFCKANYDRFYTFNLFDRSDIVSLFAEDINTQEKIDKLELIVGEKIDFESSILFFDEVQESEELISSLKFFAESETNYNVICAGSLLGVRLSRFRKPFPVGKVKMLHMRPMGFEEFLLAFEKEGLVEEIKSCAADARAMTKPLHDMALKLYRTYLCSGGMPEAVVQMAAMEGDVLRFDEAILSDIMAAYLSDMGKYIATPMEKARIEAIYRSIPSPAKQ
jgi:predicted AAA+ superfamily ATPase